MAKEKNIFEKALIDPARYILDTGKEMLGLSTEGSRAYQQLLADGHDILNKTNNAFTTSSDFWIREKQILGNNYTSNEIEEALMAREIEQEKKLLEGTGKTLDVENFRKERNAAPDYIAYVDQYMANREKAGKYTLRSEEYSDTGQLIARKRYVDPIRNSLNKTSRRLKDHYGFIPALFKLTGLGIDRTLTSHTVGDYDLMLPKGDTEFNNHIISTLGNYLDSKQGSLEDTDVDTLRTLLKNMVHEYTPVITGQKATMGDYNTHKDTAPRIKSIMDGNYSDAFQALSITLTKGTPDDTSDDQDVKFTTFLSSNNLKGKSRDKFHEDWNTLSAFIMNVFNNSALVPEGGYLKANDVLEMALGSLIDMGNLKVTTSKGGFDVETGYTELTGRQVSDYFELLPEMLNRFTATDLLTDEDFININNEIESARTEYRHQQIELDDSHPINVANRIVGGIGDKGDAGFIDPKIFNSIEERTSFIEDYIQRWQTAGYANDDIEAGQLVLGTALVDEAESSALTAIQENISTEDEALSEEDLNKLSQEMYGVANYLDLKPKQLKKIENPIASINELSNNITQEYYNKNLPSMYNYTWERFITNPEDLDTVREMRAYKNAGEKTPLAIAEEWWKERGIPINNFKKISKYLYSNISLLGDFREVNYDPVAFAFQQEGLSLPDMSLTLLQRVRKNLLDRDK